MAQMPEKDKELLEEIDFLKEKYFTYDLPVPFCGLMMYPVSVRNYNEFLTSNVCFLLNKNDDPKGVMMSHLDYLVSKMQDETEGGMWSMRFSRLLELIFHFKNGYKCEKCGKNVSFEDFIAKVEGLRQRYEAGEDLGDNINIYECECGGTLREMIKLSKDEKTNKTILIVDGKTITNNDFYKLRRIALYQNLPDYKDDSWVDKAIRDDQAAKVELESKTRGSVKASLERKILCLSTELSYKLEDIYNMPMRKFIMSLNIIDKKISYIAERIGLMTGMVSTKNGY